MALKSIYATGRRKTASARVYVAPVAGDQPTFVVNRRVLGEYFPTETMCQRARVPLALVEKSENYDVKVFVRGGGVSGQADAVCHGLSRALEKAEPELRATLKKAGLLTRDSRAVERKKPGRHKARKRPQFSKR